MQRPSERLIKEFNLYKKFKEKNIRTVLNLQEPGEVQLVIVSIPTAETGSFQQLDSATSLSTSINMGSNVSTKAGKT